VATEPCALEDVDPEVKKEREEIDQCCDHIIEAIHRAEFNLSGDDTETLELMVKLGCRNPSPTGKKEHYDVMLNEILGHDLMQIQTVLNTSILAFGYKIDNADKIKDDHEKEASVRSQEMELLEPLIEKQRVHIQDAENRATAIKEDIRKIKTRLQDDKKATTANERFMDQCTNAVGRLQKLMRLLEPCSASPNSEHEAVEDATMSSKDIKLGIMQIEKVLVQMNCEKCLLDGLMTAFSEPQDLSDTAGGAENTKSSVLTHPDYFGRVIATTIQNRLEQREKKLKEIARASEESRPVAEAELEQAEAQLAAQENLLSQAESKLAELRDALRAHEEKLHSSQDGIKNHSKNLMEWKKNYNQKTKTLAQFNKHTLSSFEFLRDKVLPPSKDEEMVDAAEKKTDTVAGEQPSNRTQTETGDMKAEMKVDMKMETQGA